MNEIKRPKTPLIFYYLIVLVVIMLVNALIMPKISERAVREVDYGTFMSMTEKQEIGKVQIQSNQILFTDKNDSNIYRTGLMDDPGLVERLYASGAEFTSQIIEQQSPLVSLLFSWLLPIIIFVVLGQFLSKKLMDKAGGDTALSCSDDTQTKIDEEVVALVKRQHEKAGKILADNRAKLDELSQYLYEKESITGDEFMAILNA